MKSVVVLVKFDGKRMVLVARFICWLMFFSFVSLQLTRTLPNYSQKVKVVSNKMNLAIHHEKKRANLEIVH